MHQAITKGEIIMAGLMYKLFFIHHAIDMAVDAYNEDHDCKITNSDLDIDWYKEHGNKQTTKMTVRNDESLYYTITFDADKDEIKITEHIAKGE